MPSFRPVQFVIKITKYCNLRCSYCYEFADLGNKERMSLDAIERMFRNIVANASATQLESAEFIWHGGEPFLIPLDYYEKIGALQREIFANRVEISNIVQTNLTLLTERHIKSLKTKKFFSVIGVSFDVYGDQRVDTRGRQSTQTVLANMQKLIDRDIAFGAIVVLGRNTLPHVQHIFRFFDEQRIGMRFLPFHLEAGDASIAGRQVAEHALTSTELVGGLKLIFDEWLASRNAVSVDPIDAYIDFAINYVTGQSGWSYQKSQVEAVFVVNIDGGVWGNHDEYDGAKKYGNLFDESFSSILNSARRRMAMDEAARRMAHFCGPCPYYGACPGHFVGDASPQQQRLLAEAGCPVREMIGYIVDKFETTGLSDVIAERAGQKRQEKKLHLVGL